MRPSKTNEEISMLPESERTEIRVIRKCSWRYRISDPDEEGIRSLEQGDSSGLEGIDGRALATVDSEASETRVGLAFTSNALRRERRAISFACR
jgi:hypothetical protein